MSAKRFACSRALTLRALLTAAALPAAFTLAACGSNSHAGAAASSTVAAASSSATGARSPASSACRSVAAPAPRGAQHIAPPRLRLDPASSYLVTLSTNCGSIAIALNVRAAPRTTASFAYLVRRGFYNDLTFHRVAANFVIQGGDPSGDGLGGPGYTVVEPPPATLRYTLGTVAMAKTAADPSGSSGSQFFIVTTREAPLPAQYALVGHVVGSFAGVDAIASLPTDPPQDGAPEQPVVISRATLSRG